MLPLVYARRAHGVEADYNSGFAKTAVDRFLGGLPGGEDCYRAGIRRLALDLYSRALTGTGKRIFLDKTPRYYLILDDLMALFPEARFVFIVRNPLAVLASMLEVTNGDWTHFRSPERFHDLLGAPAAMVQAMETLGQRGVRVSYEDLVTEPASTVATVCRGLDLAFEPAMLAYGDRLPFEAGGFGDRKSIHRHGGPVADYREGWRHRLSRPPASILARSYLELLGAGLVGRLGYDYESLLGAGATGRLSAPLVRGGQHLLTANDRRRPRWQRLAQRATERRW